ncbi:hypothetical protein R3Q06_31660, partial [Rhodococcus erythropolis]
MGARKLLHTKQLDNTYWNGCAAGSRPGAVTCSPPAWPGWTPSWPAASRTWDRENAPDLRGPMKTEVDHTDNPRQGPAAGGLNRSLHSSLTRASHVRVVPRKP